MLPVTERGGPEPSLRLFHAGPAVGATFLVVRQGSGSGAINPLFAASSASFSDAFLLLTAAAVVALVAASGLKRNIGKGGKGA